MQQTYGTVRGVFHLQHKLRLFAIEYILTNRCVCFLSCHLPCGCVNGRVTDMSDQGNTLITASSIDTKVM
jgi:hypothetical protein